MNQLTDHLADDFRRGRIYLVANRGQMFLARKSSIFGRKDGPGPLQLCVLNLRQLWTSFDQLTEGRQSFTRQEVNGLTGLADLSEYEAARVIAFDDDGKADWLATFGAATVATLCRAGVPLEVAARAGRYIRTGSGDVEAKPRRRAEVRQ
jgi:hypothetical protein